MQSNIADIVQVQNNFARGEEHVAAIPNRDI
jgi:hypothetical protein